ncbi:MAG: epoxyqueuosine reductase [Desulforhopalus sp.]
MTVDITNLRLCVTEFCRGQIRQQQLPNWWRDPVLATADADERFAILPQIAAPNHLLPSELLISCRTVVVFFIPFTEELSDSNIDGKFPSDDWGRSLAITNALLQDISVFMRTLFAHSGYQSELTPATYNYDPDSFTARWSHKHLGYLTGLGRFGINAQLITPAGCAGRLGSLVTEAPLGNNPLVEKEELCLHKNGDECLLCIQSCPVQAVTLKGIDRHACNQRLQINRKRFSAKTSMRDDVEVCAKCVSGMPCSLRAPKKIK